MCQIHKHGINDLDENQDQDILGNDSTWIRKTMFLYILSLKFI